MRSKHRGANAPKLRALTGIKQLKAKFLAYRRRAVAMELVAIGGTNDQMITFSGQAGALPFRIVLCTAIPS